jgi:hypothetical protein
MPALRLQGIGYMAHHDLGYMRHQSRKYASRIAITPTSRRYKGANLLIRVGILYVAAQVRLASHLSTLRTIIFCNSYLPSFSVIQTVPDSL